MTREEFLKDFGNWSNHRILLWEALEATKNKSNYDTIISEFGCGDGSTPFLHKYAEDNKRYLVSYENNLEWMNKYRHLNGEYHMVYHIHDWDKVGIVPSVLLIDHAPGERRKIDIRIFADKARVIVCHDTEPAADHGYQMRAEFGKFKYHIDYKTDGAWASAVSNFIDVTKFKI